MAVTAKRYHDISCGHRVVGHEGKCQHLHGHNYRVHFEVVAPSLDDVGRVLDFGVIKSCLCQWLEDNWDHKFLAWEDDELMRSIRVLHFVNGEPVSILVDPLAASIVWVPFNPTAENMAQYLVEVIGPQQLEGTGCILQSVSIEETRKCSVTFTKE